MEQTLGEIKTRVGVPADFVGYIQRRRRWWTFLPSLLIFGFLGTFVRLLAPGLSQKQSYLLLRDRTIYIVTLRGSRLLEQLEYDLSMASDIKVAVTDEVVRVRLLYGKQKTVFRLWRNRFVDPYGRAVAGDGVPRKVWAVTAHIASRLARRPSLAPSAAE